MHSTVADLGFLVASNNGSCAKPEEQTGSRTLAISSFAKKIIPVCSASRTLAISSFAKKIIPVCSARGAPCGQQNLLNKRRHKQVGLWLTSPASRRFDMPVRPSRPGDCSPRSQLVFASIWWRPPNLPRDCNAMSLSWSMRSLYLQDHPSDA